MSERITMSRAKGWRKPEGAIVVARPSIWGNPWVAGNPGTFMDRGDKRITILPIDAERAVDLFETWLADAAAPSLFLPHTAQWPNPMIRGMHDALHARRMQILANLDQLRGHDLCCWCKPGEPCHADVLLRLANV